MDKEKSTEKIDGAVATVMALDIQHEIDIFKSYVSITNPGCFANSCIPEDYFLKNRSSVLRNKIIANVLYRCKDFESFGSGLKKVYTLCEDSKTPISYNMGNDFFTFSFQRNLRNVVLNVVKDVVCKNKISRECRY